MFIRALRLFLVALVYSIFSVYSGVFGCSGPSEEATNGFPETCAEAKEAAIEETGTASNGTYTLYVDGDESMPWEAYCHDMSQAEPTEYLTVNQVDNYSQISNGIVISETSYLRYRIDPIRLEIWPLDDTFAESNFDDEDAPTLPEGMEHIPAGWAEYQVPSEETDPVVAESKADLSDTAFVFSEDIDDDGFFCNVSSSDEVEQFSEGTEAEVASDLVSFVLTAITTYPVFGSSIREVADCTNLGSDFDTMTELDVDAATWPLEYVGE